MTRLVQRREQGREAGTCWGEQREMWMSWESSMCKEGMQKRGWRDRNEEVGQGQVEYVIIFDLKTLKAFKTCQKLFSPQMFTAYYFLRGRKGASYVNMKEEFQDKCPLRFVWSILGKKEMAVFKTKISVCNKNIFFFFFYCILWYWGMVTFSFSLCSGFPYFKMREGCSCYTTFISMVWARA